MLELLDQTEMSEIVQSVYDLKTLSVRLSDNHSAAKAFALRYPIISKLNEFGYPVKCL